MEIQRLSKALKPIMLSSAVALASFYSAQAHAVWRAAQNLDGTVTSKISCTKGDAGTKAMWCAYKGKDNALMAIHFDGSVWEDHQYLDGTMVSNPSCTTDGTNKTLCVFSGADHSLYAKWFDGETWGDFEYLGGITDRDPSCANSGAGSVTCVIKDSGTGLYSKTFNGTTWSSGFTYIPGPAIASSPSCTHVGGSSLVCAATGIDNKLHGYYYNGTVWKYQALGVNSYSDPSCTSDGAGKALCTGVGANGALYAKSFSGTKWAVTYSPSNPKNNGQISAEPSCAYTSAANAKLANLVCAVRNANGGMYSRSFNGTSWSADYSLLYKDVSGSLPQPITGAPTCVGDGAGQVTCMAIDTVTGNLISTSGN